MQITLTIFGNHIDPEANPIPKAKLTRGQQWTDKAQAYAAWKIYVQEIFCKAAKIALTYQKPIDLQPQQSARMDLKIWWANEKHGDPENVFGSIADAIFENDKHLDGSFKAMHDPEHKGRVEVKIKIDEK